MDTLILDNISFEPDYDELAQRLRVRPGRSSEKELIQLLDEARQIARPKAIYRIGYIDAKTEDSVSIGDTILTSRVLRVNLEATQRCFLYIATCGRELHEWQHSISDMLAQFYADTISNAALQSARTALEEHLTESYNLGHTATMNPGSLEDWPLQAQIPLFKMLGNTQNTIGVELLDSLLMVPGQTVSGIRFETESSFASCQLCPRESCPNRKAPYDAELFDQKFAAQ
ncbi:MAG: vitamin B12 dependent methionine synthase [Chloroflexi bacterium]|jgi:hypothetical protein|nr:vitamin B12 dependent methionine synthase [Chloroflexota bacterium]